MSTRPLILVVDDDVMIRRCVARILRALGAEVVEASDGREALALLRADAIAPDVITTDVSMPALDGLALVEALRDDPRLRGLPIVVLSGEEIPPSTRRRVDACISKPFRAADLVAVVELATADPGRTPDRAAP